MTLALAVRGQGGHRRSIDDEGRIEEVFRRAFFGKGVCRRKRGEETSGISTPRDQPEIEVGWARGRVAVYWLVKMFCVSFRVKYDTSSLLNVVTPKMTPTRRTVVTVSSVTTLGGVFRCLLSDCSDRFAKTMMTTQTTRALILVSRISLYPLHQWRIEDTQSIVSSARESRG